MGCSRMTADGTADGRSRSGRSRTEADGNEQPQQEGDGQDCRSGSGHSRTTANGTADGRIRIGRTMCGRSN